MAVSSGESGRDWTALWEAAANSLVGHPPFEAVYTGPVWKSGGTSGTRVWKIAVLERRSSGGADHWGHLFAVVGENASTVLIHPEGGMSGGPDRPAPESLPGIPGVPFAISIRPLSGGTAARLRAFAAEFQSRAAVLATT
jgi:hypothetical protein